jgi:hypothetical protein
LFDAVLMCDTNRLIHYVQIPYIDLCIVTAFVTLAPRLVVAGNLALLLDGVEDATPTQTAFEIVVSLTGSPEASCVSQFPCNEVFHSCNVATVML